MAIRAGIDIGTNTILLLVAEVENGSVSKVLEDQVRVVRLGQGVDKFRQFQPEALDRARACFREYAEILKKYPGVICRAVATSGSRDASNSAEFFQEVKRDYGISVDVISGMEEARLSFLGSVPSDTKDLHSVAVLDIGGGSTEIVGLEKASQEFFRFSFDMGCVRMTERFLPSDPPKEEELAALRETLKRELANKKELFRKVSGRRLIGVAGTATYLASSDLGLSKFVPEKVHGHTLSRQSIERLSAEWQKLKASERLGIGGMDKGRADVIVAGAVILDEVLRAAELESVWISTRGLRFGAVLA